eukprot:CAMPEP_0172683390 /NCGR_PEP_ID=MMETSP1074-20121228/18813_1 /TAXON_ID=2916 /ORGANISM="Ceratium fusus, Strain PA161109" /LENGTH=218 /DNA_ID=CAMNT_0013502231 /DNA_START=10 /DNA_END=666 /DNA_ORIENTATION=+
MFDLGGKKLKDMSEEDIRAYAASFLEQHGAASSMVNKSALDNDVDEARQGIVAQVGNEPHPPGMAVDPAIEPKVPEVPLDAEANARLAALAELDRSQMPAISYGDGVLLKTIEHYTFADTAEVATIYIELDKDLWNGASDCVTDASVDVACRESEVTITLQGVPTARAASTLANWRLHLAPMFHSVVPELTSWRLRNGKVSIKLKKKKAQDWRKVLKY